MTLVLLDLDGTLVDGSGLPGAMRATCEVLAAVTGAPAEALAAANTASWQRRWPAIEEDYMLGGRAGEDIVRETWSDALAACGVRDPAAVDAAIAAWELQERAALRLFPDALPALDALVRGGAGIGMVTNGAGSVQRQKLAAAGILDRFDPLIVSGEVGVAKPAPEIFEIALHAAGSAAAETWFVGDNLWNDVPGAVEAGMRTVWLDRHGAGLPEDGPRPTEVVRTLEALPGLV